jgi:hypothetical protein
MKTRLVFKNADGSVRAEVIQDISAKDLLGDELKVGGEYSASFGELPPDQAAIEFTVERFGVEEHPEHEEVFVVYLVRPPLN